MIELNIIKFSDEGDIVAESCDDDDDIIRSVIEVFRKHEASKEKADEEKESIVGFDGNYIIL